MDKTYSITDVPGIKVGHAQDFEALTGCTVLLCEDGAIAGVDQRGGAPGTRETDLLRPLHLVQQIHALLLSGGSAFGLEAAGGVMRYLEERKIGFNTGTIRVPIVPAAIIYDLGIGRSDIRPDSAMGYQACLNASKAPPAMGNIGAGTGASVGKILGMAGAMKGGIGDACVKISRGIYVGAIAIVNVFGDVVDPQSGKIIAGTRSQHNGPVHIGKGDYFADTQFVMQSFIGKTALRFASRENTLIGAVATNARLNKEQANFVAQMAHDGIARTIRPAHTMLDGDTIFALSTGKRQADVNLVGALSAEVFAEAILRGVRAAKSVGEIPASSDVF